MPQQIYTVEIDGTQYDLEGDHEPSEAEARQAVAGQQPKTASPPPASATIGMLQPSTLAGPPKQSFRDRLMNGPQITDPQSGEPVPMLGGPGILADASTVGSLGSAVTMAKGIPGILARAGGISKVRAGANIEQALQAAKASGLTVDASNTAAKGLRAVELKAAKFRVPQAITSFMERATGPNQSPLAAQEMHDLASNLSEQSINEVNAIKRPVKRIVSTMSHQARQDLIEALNQIGKGDTYASGIKEYARASKAGKYAGNAAKVAGTAATGYLGWGWLRRLLAD